MTTQAKLSVIVPCYNHGAYVDQALSALREQSRPADEVLVLDDGSSDDSYSIITRHAAEDRRLRVGRHAQNRGNLATALELTSRASGELFYAGAADDYVLPGFFEAATAALDRHPQIGLVCGQVLGVDARGRVERRYGPDLGSEPLYLSPEAFRRHLLEAQPPYVSLSSATMYRRARFDEIGWRTELGSWADTFIGWAIGLKYGACYLPWPCTAWRRLPNSYSRTRWSNLGEKLAVVDRAAALMRSPAFVERFPESFVRSWSRGYKRCVWLSWGRTLYRSAIRRRAA